VDEDGVVSGHDQIKAACALIEDVYFATERSIDGESVLYLEVADENMRVDAAVLKNYNSFGVGVDYTVAFATGDPLIGEECRATVDGLVVDNVTPSVGNVMVAIGETYAVDDTDTEIRIGLNFDTAVTPMPFNMMGQNGNTLIGKQRIVKGKVKVRNTLGLRMNGRVLPDRNFDIDSFDAALDPYTGNIVLEESTNWDEDQDKVLHFTQVDPLPMEILGIEVVLEGAP
jgi:hypothetical protein